MILRIVLSILIFLVSLGIFFPKHEMLDYAFHQYAKQYDITLDVSAHEGFLSDTLLVSELSYNGEGIANIKSINLFSLFFYNEITADNMELKGLALGFIPPYVEYLRLGYHIFDPLHIPIHAQGDFGTLEGRFNFYGNKLILHLFPSKIMSEKYNFVLGKGTQQDKSYVYEFSL